MDKNTYTIMYIFKPEFHVDSFNNSKTFPFSVRYVSLE